MSRLDELQRKQEAIAAEIAAEKSKMREEMLQHVRKAIRDFEITHSEVKAVLKARKSRAKSAGTAAPLPDGVKRPRGRPRKNRDA